MTAQGSPATRYRRAIETKSVFLAEIAAREMPHLSLADAVALIALYAERGTPEKFERSAVRWLQRLLLERERLGLREVQLAAVVLAELPAHPEGAETLRKIARE